MKDPGGGQAGFSLVELMVASFILAISVIALVAMIEKGTYLDVTGDHRRQARALLNEVLENGNYTHSKYNSMPDDILDSIVNLERTAGTGDPIEASLEIIVDPTATYPVQETNVPYKQVTAKIEWPRSQPEDSVVVIKWIADALPLQ